MNIKYQKILYYCIIFFAILLLSACSQKVDPREKEIVQLLNNKNYDEAVQRANELYKDENDKLVEIINYIEEDKERDLYRKQMKEEIYPSSKLEIQQNHKSKIQNDYIYITGRVKNVSNKDINYFEVRCDFLDKNDQVLDSDYTNDNLVLKPGEMREFEIMHRYKDEYEKYKLLIGDVK
ncbi:hypothetical protein SPSYN_01824 [Sporotomaculum syntrophicum]|uniref:Lipoprotein n=1 Tax=Sporotomaculum syntrophicum TaxID=182264 RepID=A0A9D2WQF4_9FIRM|nr:FxLYD domain-containing protein [Sporotomaculum syntrophicum]KAF1085680.1 hypothetical protein SPSYN_01824 [Sporotomaculum syntrophicum]